MCILCVYYVYICAARQHQARLAKVPAASAVMQTTSLSEGERCSRMLEPYLKGSLSEVECLSEGEQTTSPPSWA